MKTNTIEFKSSNVHQGHYVYINGQETGIVVNLFAYDTIEEYKNQVDIKIKNYERTVNNIRHS